MKNILNQQSSRGKLREELKLFQTQAAHFRSLYIKWHDLYTSLYDRIAHGDEQHREWLRQAIEDHALGKVPLPPPPPNVQDVTNRAQLKKAWDGSNPQQKAGEGVKMASPVPQSVSPAED